MIRDRLLLEVNSELLNMFPRSGASVIYEYSEEVSEPEPGPSIEEVDIPPELKKALSNAGIKRLFKFQYDAFEYIKSGYHTIITAGTGTGKTEAFLLPILADIYSNPSPYPRAILTYPTKALSRDQFNRFQKYLVFGRATAGIYDGDTPPELRKRMRENPPSIVITNPDMIHIGLVRSPAIRQFIERARFLVVDELHVYEGVLGSHLKYIIDRVKARNNRGLIFIGSSATLSNPKAFAESLFGVDVAVVQGPVRRRGVAVHSLVSTGYLSRWTVAAALSAILAKKGLKHIIFVDSQQMAELVARIGKSYGSEVMVHRAGLPAEERRRIEEKLRRGEILAVAATPTLELGIDIGDLDAVVLASPPPSYTKYLQRAGRVGRRGRPGYVFTVLSDDPIDAYYERNPEKYFSQDMPPLVIEPENEEVGKIHLLARLLEEGSIKLSSLNGFWRTVYTRLLEENLAYVKGLHLYPRRKIAFKYLDECGSIRSSGPQVKIVDKVSGETLAYRELPQAVLDLYPGAIYLIQTKPFLSLGLDFEEKTAWVRPLEENITYYTKPLYTVEVGDYTVLDERVSSRGIPLSYASVELALIVEGYIVRDVFSEKAGERIWLDQPLKYSYRTKAVLVKYPTKEGWSLADHAEAFHAIEHTIISAARIVCGAGLTDMGGVSYPSGDIVIYDASPGGSGLSKLLFERFEEAERIAFEIVSRCDCEDGCPRCIYSPYCGNNNQVLSRRKAMYYLGSIIGKTITTLEKPLEKRYGKPIA
ncbi:DEAD/DEAH box helicase [Thermogladius sp. 4427co]|uniref:DEAD/DEAH box helicase n=1 Tax=Thermogladius sp. 4427co TaxID=3450718 RepID=UPI003F7AC8B7